MDAARFDALATSLTEIRSRRGALRGLLLGAGGLLTLTAQDAAARTCKKIKNKQKRKKCRAKTAPPPPVLPPVPPPPPGPPPPPCGLPCGDGCCPADACFAETVSPAGDRPVLSYACCPAASLCRSPTASLPDQCCYPDEVCNARNPDPVEGLCCRTCGSGCCSSSQECGNPVTGECIGLNTARLPRTRRPG